jgi:serine/threonine-protein kinase
VNPFHHRGPITDPAHFFGRSRELEAVLSRTAHASKPQCVSLVGTRRIGKSSLLRQIVDVRGPELAAQASPMVTVYESLEGAGNLTVDRFFSGLLRKVARQLRRLDVKAPAMPEDATGGGPEQAFSDWMEELTDDGLRIVIFLDEFDVVTMNPAFDAGVFGRLRYLASSFSLAYVTSSYGQLADLCHRDEIRQSPFFNIFSTSFLGLMTADEAEEMLVVESERAGARFGADELQFLGELSGTHPVHLQQAASALWEAEDPSNGEGVRRAFLDEASPHFRYAVRHLSDVQRELLFSVARGGRIDPDRDGDAAFLLRRGLVRKVGDRCEPFSPTFGAWLGVQEETTAREAPRAISTFSGVDAGTSPTGGPPAHPRVGHVLEDRWELQREVGRGGFGVVFAAADRMLSRQVAVKVLRPDRSVGARSAQTRERFLREARTAARINHPNVLVVHDVREQAAGLFIVMELLPGRSLRDVLRERARLPVREALDVLAQAADGIAAAHALDIVHRDIKPENLVLDASGRIKVVDFGLAWLLGEARLSSESGELMTPRYSSPEQIEGGDVGTPSDVFSLSCVLFEALTGRRAFDGSTISEVLHRILHETPPDLDVDLPEPSAALRDLLTRGLARKAEDRPTDAAVFASELRRLAAGK